MVKTNYEVTIGDRKFEVSYSGTGSFSPWQSEVLHRYGISAMCTSDVAEFMKVNDAIYRLHGGILKVYDYLSTLSDLYNEGHKDEVEKELDDWLNSFYLEKQWNNLHDWRVAWGIEATEVIDEIFDMYDKYHDDPAMMKEKWVPELETIENAAKLYGHFANWGCYRPDYDMIYTTPYHTIVFDITLPYDSNDSYMSLEIGKTKFGYFTQMEGHINELELDGAEINKYNIEKYLYPFLKKDEKKRTEYMKKLDAKIRDYKKHPKDEYRDLENEEQSDVQ